MDLTTFQITIISVIIFLAVGLIIFSVLFNEAVKSLSTTLDQYDNIIMGLRDDLFKLHTELFKSSDRQRAGLLTLERETQADLSRIFKRIKYAETVLDLILKELDKEVAYVEEHQILKTPNKDEQI